MKCLRLQRRSKRNNLMRLKQILMPREGELSRSATYWKTVPKKTRIMMRLISKSLKLRSKSLKETRSMTLKSAK